MVEILVSLHPQLFHNPNRSEIDRGCERQDFARIRSLEVLISAGAVLIGLFNGRSHSTVNRFCVLLTSEEPNYSDHPAAFLAEGIEIMRTCK
jgi:hypothetical protein